MSEKNKTSKADAKQTTAKSDATKASAENKAQETAGKSGDATKKSDAPKSASQSSISHFSSVSTPQYRAGWDKIFNNSQAEEPTAEQPSKYEQRKMLVSEQWSKYQETKNPKYLAVICRNLPFFDHPAVGEEIASLLLKK